MASKTKTGKKPVGRDRVVFDVLSVAVLTVLSLFCLLPFWLVISGSFSDQASILTHGYRLIPETFSLEAYQTPVSYTHLRVRAAAAAKGVV